MFLPLRTDSPLRNTPYVNWLIIAANVIVFIFQHIYSGMIGRYGLIPSHPHLTSFFTYMFLHDASSPLPLHLFFNMLFLYIFGNNVNDKMGSLGYLGFYLGGGVFAGICETLSTHSGAPVIGASGAISAVTGAYLVLLPRSHVTIFFMFFFIGAFELQSMWFILFFFAQDLFLSRTADSVAHMAHIGGSVYGAAVCLFLLGTRLLPRDQYDVWALLSRWNKRRQYRDLVAKGFNPFEPAPVMRGGRQIPDATMDRVHELRGQISSAIGQRDFPAAAELYLQLKSIDPDQVLSRQAQLDVATQLHHAGQYSQAVEAYEQLLKVYPNVERSEQVELMLGLIYARYLRQYERARQHLNKAISRLHEGRELDLAREELKTIQPHLPPA